MLTAVLKKILNNYFVAIDDEKYLSLSYGNMSGNGYYHTKTNNCGMVTYLIHTVV